jgi:hypothetical protein
MTSYQMTLTKSAYNGWNADTVIPMGSVEITSLGEKKLCRRVLEISTSKRRPGLISSFANVSTIEDCTSSDGKSYSVKPRNYSAVTPNTSTPRRQRPRQKRP